MQTPCATDLPADHHENGRAAGIACRDEFAYSPARGPAKGHGRRALGTRSRVLHVLFVCTGNICRSPTAERLAAMYAAQLDIPDFSTSSAGTRAVISHPVHPEAALVLKNLGGDPSDFAARQLTPRIASAADLVLTMTRVHRDAVLELAPRQLRKAFTLAEATRLISDHNPRDLAELAALRPQLAGLALRDMPDPIGQDPEFFAAIGAQIADALAPILELCRRSSARPKD